MNPSSDLAVCYQTLELPPDATEQEIKLAYRQLARRYHPDLNPGDLDAEARFRQIVQAYKTLLTALKHLPQAPHTKSYSDQPKKATAKETRSSSSSTSHKPVAHGRVRFYVQHPAQTAPQSILSPEDSWFKERSLNQLDNLMKRRKWHQAIDLAESLAARFPSDPDVYRSQALVYHGWAKNLLDHKQYEPARIYLKKALQTDPHNRQLWAEIEQDYKRMERQLKL